VPFREKLSHHPCDLTPVAHLLNEVMRRTLLPRKGYREGLTRIQLWLLSHLVSQTKFDIRDVLLSEMEDTLAEGFKGHHLLSYAHWICFLIILAIERAGSDRARGLCTELSTTSIEFLAYDPHQLMRQGQGNREATQHQRLVVPKIEEE
jgi:hypothetical protein